MEEKGSCDDEDLESDEGGNIFDKLLRRTEDPRRNELIASYQDSCTDESEEFTDSEESENGSDRDESEDDDEEDVENAESELTTKAQKSLETPISRSGEPSEKDSIYVINVA